METISNLTVWLWLFAALLVGLHALAGLLGSSHLKDLARMTVNVVLCAAFFYVMYDPIVVFIRRLGSCVGEGWVDCAIQSAIFNFQIVVVIIFALWVIADLLLSIWRMSHPHRRA